MFFEKLLLESWKIKVRVRNGYCAKAGKARSICFRRLPLPIFVRLIVRNFILVDERLGSPGLVSKVRARDLNAARRVIDPPDLQ